MYKDITVPFRLTPCWDGPPTPVRDVPRNWGNASRNWGNGPISGGMGLSPTFFRDGPRNRGSGLLPTHLPGRTPSRHGPLNLLIPFCCLAFVCDKMHTHTRTYLLPRY